MSIPFKSVLHRTAQIQNTSIMNQHLAYFPRISIMNKLLPYCQFLLEMKLMHPRAVTCTAHSAMIHSPLQKPAHLAVWRDYVGHAAWLIGGNMKHTEAMLHTLGAVNRQWRIQNRNLMFNVASLQAFISPRTTTFVHYFRQSTLTEICRGYFIRPPPNHSAHWGNTECHYRLQLLVLTTRYIDLQGSWVEIF